MANPRLTALSLFSGYGGLDLGVERALARLGVGLDVAAYVEREAYPAALLLQHIEAGRLPAAPVWTDVTTFEGQPFRGLVDLIVGGFPCQDLSSAGSRAGIDGARSGLWGEIVRLAGEIRPRFVFVENVAGLLACGNLGRVLGDLAALGFDARWTSLRASDIGASHRRERVFLLAYTGHASVADSDGGRRKGRGQSQCPRIASESRSESERCGEDGGFVRPFPPGPDDADAWRAVLAERPELAPAVDFAAAESDLRGLADGSRARLAAARRWRAEALRAGGNGVVPAQAEAALLHLLGVDMT